MSFKVLFATAAVLSLSIGSATQAADIHVTGQQLLSLCTANLGGQGNPMEAAECLGFVVGVADTFDCVEKNHGYTWNSSVQASQPQLAGIVINYLQNHPAALNEEAHRAIGAALQESFPCTPKRVAN